MRTQNFLVLMILLFTGSSVFAQPSLQCQDLSNTPFPTRICTQIPENSSGEVLYYLHGRGGLPDRWADSAYYTMQIQKYWQAHNIAAPIVIAVGMSPLLKYELPNVWLLTKKNSQPASGLLDYFEKTIVPFAESTLPIKVTTRSVVGESMGGLNTIQLAFKTQLFQKAATICPVFTDVNPLSELSVLIEAAKKTVAWSYYADENDPTKSPTVEDAITSVYPLPRIFFDQDGWSNSDPFYLARSANPKLLPQLYVAIGMHDKYACYETVEKWVSELEASGIKPQWHPMWGGHCVVDIPSLAKFLTK